jgi:Mg/Co/Ni transporter MgtE
VIHEDEGALSLLWDTLFESESKALAQKPVKDVMVPVNQFVAPDDPLSKAAYKMLRHNLILLPVLDEKKKLVGLIRMSEIFDKITDIILSERS